MADGSASVVTEADRRFAELGNALWNDTSERGRTFRAFAKEKYPDAVTIEDQFDPIVKPLREEAAALRAELAAEAQRRTDEAEARTRERAERTLQDGLEAARKRFNLTDAGMDLTIKRMQDTGNYSDPLAAAAAIVADNPPPKDPTGYLGPQNINLFGSANESAEDRIRLLHKDPMGGFLDAEFRDFISDPDAYVRNAGIAA